MDVTGVFIQSYSVIYLSLLDIEETLNNWASKDRKRKIWKSQIVEFRKSRGKVKSGGAIEMKKSNR